MLHLQVALNGILLGGVYALMGLGMALIWGVMDIVNIAHGAFIVLGGYASFWMFQLWGLDPFGAIPLTMVLLFALGFLVQKFVINQIIRSELFFTLLITFGLDILILNLIQLAWKADFRRLNPSYSLSSLRLGELTLPWVRLGAFGIAILITALLFWLMNRTKLGRAIRATAQDLEGARLAGVKVSNTYAITYGLGAAMAGAAGTLIAMLQAINPGIGGELTLKSFVIAVLGGLGSTWGPVVGGLALGLVEEFGSLWAGDTMRNVLSFGLLVVVLIVWPTGILGRRS